MRAVKLVGVGLAVATLSACGSAHRTRLHDYSVQQVKHVFAAEGIALREARYGPAVGVVKLTNRQVEVDVDTGHNTTKWQSVTAGDLRMGAVANVIVSYPPSQMHAVKAALRSLKT